MSWPVRAPNGLAACDPFDPCSICLAEDRAFRTGIYGADLWCCAFMVAASMLLRVEGMAQP